MCVTVGFCVEDIYIPLHPLFIRGESTQTEPLLPPYISEKRTTYSCVEIKLLHSHHMKLDF
jgi:hypothetical protein